MRLIDADELRLKIIKAERKFSGVWASLVMGYIAESPTVDPDSVVPVAAKPIMVTELGGSDIPFTYPKCANCGQHLNPRKNNYCEYCGQWLDWSEKKEGFE